jgi:cell division transport system ATP-binding protein
MLFVLKATGWTIKEDMDRKIDEVLDKVGMKTGKMPSNPVENNNVSPLPEHCLMIPELILADEPTGNLDPQTSAEVLEF